MRTLSLMLLPLAALAACPAAEPEVGDSGESDTANPDDTAAQDTATRGDDGDEDYVGGCDYTSTALGAEDAVDLLGGLTPTAYAAAISGTRSSTFAWTYTGATTPLDHTLTLDASTALLWEGAWTSGGEGSDTGGFRPDDDTPDEERDVGDSGGASSEEEDGGTDEPGDTDTDDTDTPVDTGTWDTGGGGGGEDCPSYVTIAGDWTLATGDGFFDEAFRVTARASADAVHIAQDVDYAALGGSWAAEELEDPASWDEVTVSFAADVGVSEDAGEVTLFASRTIPSDDGDYDLGEAMMGEVGRWGTESTEE